MVKITLVSIAASIAFLGIAVQDVSPDETVDRVYVGDGAKVEGVGACNITSDKVECWNMDGVADPSLVGLVTAQLNSRNQGSQLSFRFGKKNRWLIVRSSGQNRSVSLQAGTGINWSPSFGTADESIQMVRALTEPEVRTYAVIATIYSLPQLGPIDLPFKVGEKVSFAGVGLELGPCKEWTPSAEDAQRVSLGAPSKKHWRMTFGFAKKQGDPYGPSMTYSLIGKDGKVIHYIDENGQPVSDMRVLSEAPSDMENGSGYPGTTPTNKKFPTAFFQVSLPSKAGATTAYTNVDPTMIGALRLTATQQKRIQINGFPLDPK